jgi:hypothetical protein
MLSYGNISRYLHDGCDQRSKSVYFRQCFYVSSHAVQIQFIPVSTPLLFILLLDEGYCLVLPCLGFMRSQVFSWFTGSEFGNNFRRLDHTEEYGWRHWRGLPLMPVASWEMKNMLKETDEVPNLVTDSHWWSSLDSGGGVVSLTPDQELGSVSWKA